MYEQDYIMRVNRDVIRTMTRLLFQKDTEPPLDLLSHELKSEDEKALDCFYGQVDMGSISQAEAEIHQHINNKEERALEKALLFYTYLNEKSDEFLEENHYSREKIQSGLRDIAAQYGILDLVQILLT